VLLNDDYQNGNFDFDVAVCVSCLMNVHHLSLMDEMN